jgi:hypothetical protein
VSSLSSGLPPRAPTTSSSSAVTSIVPAAATDLADLSTTLDDEEESASSSSSIVAAPSPLVGEGLLGDDENMSNFANSVDDLECSAATASNSTSTLVEAAAVTAAVKANDNNNSSFNNDNGITNNAPVDSLLPPAPLSSREPSLLTRPKVQYKDAVQKLNAAMEEAFSLYNELVMSSSSASLSTVGLPPMSSTAAGLSIRDSNDTLEASSATAADSESIDLLSSFHDSFANLQNKMGTTSWRRGAGTTSASYSQLPSINETPDVNATAAAAGNNDAKRPQTAAAQSSIGLSSRLANGIEQQQQRLQQEEQQQQLLRPRTANGLYANTFSQDTTANATNPFDGTMEGRGDSTSSPMNNNLNKNSSINFEGGGLDVSMVLEKYSDLLMQSMEAKMDARIEAKLLAARSSKN